MKFHLEKKGLVVLLLVGFVTLFAAASALANPYAKYAGTTLVINFPNIAYYNYAVQVIPEFTKETGIKVEIDRTRVHEDAGQAAARDVQTQGRL